VPDRAKERKSAAEPQNLVHLLKQRRQDQLISYFRQYKVNSVQTNEVTLNTGSGTIPNVRYLDSYSPSTGDTVWCIESGNDIIVLGKLA